MTSKEFIDMIAPVIVRNAKQNGFKTCSVIIAQACCESGFNRSSLSSKYHNYFGLKCGSKWKGRSVNLKTKEEYVFGTIVSITDNFRVFDSMEDGVKGYFDFVSTKRYSNLKTSKTPKEYAENLKKDGYATSSSYVTTLLSYVNKYGLERFDRELNATTVSTPTATSETQVKLEHIVIKGDTLTKIAKQHNLTVDYLVKLNGIKNKNIISIGQKIKLK